MNSTPGSPARFVRVVQAAGPAGPGLAVCRFRARARKRGARRRKGRRQRSSIDSESFAWDMSGPAPSGRPPCQPVSCAAIAPARSPKPRSSRRDLLVESRYRPSHAAAPGCTRPPMTALRPGPQERTAARKRERERRPARERKRRPARDVCAWIHQALGVGSLANARTALASELRAASPVRPWCPDYGPRAAASAHLTRARRRTGSRRRRMEQRWVLGGPRSGALEEGRERRTRGHQADGEAGRTTGPKPDLPEVEGTRLGRELAYQV
jgi:hypothetical protein